MMKNSIVQFSFINFGRKEILSFRRAQIHVSNGHCIYDQQDLKNKGDEELVCSRSKDRTFYDGKYQYFEIYFG